MSKFNSTTNQKNKEKLTTNLAGGLSYNNDFESEFTNVILNSMLIGDRYYESETYSNERIIDMVETTSKLEFVAKAMVYVRTDGNLRSISHLLAVLLAESINAKGQKWLRKAFFRTMIRPDDTTEIVALWNTRNPSKNIPNALRRAIKDRLETFDSYQLKKYEGLSKTVKLRDVVKLSRPRPYTRAITLEHAKFLYKNDYTIFSNGVSYNRKESGLKFKEIKESIEDTLITTDDVFKELIEGNLPKIDTAQTVNADLSDIDRANKYIDMVKNKKLGYMALLKNLKYIVPFLTKDNVNIITEMLENTYIIRKSKILPFRFIDARNALLELEGYVFIIKTVLSSLEKGFLSSSENINFVEDNETIGLLLDDSYSMTKGEGSKSPFEYGSIMMSSMLSGIENKNVLGYLWSDSARKVNTDISGFNFLDNVFCKGGGTDISSVFDELIYNNIFLDKIVVFTDMMLYDNMWDTNIGTDVDRFMTEYKKINPNVKLMFWDLGGYSTVPYKKRSNIMELSGYSDKTLELLPYLWEDNNFLIKTIDEIEL